MPSLDEALEVDFAALAIDDKEFGSIYRKHNGHIDFQDAATVQQLTKSILKSYFNLSIDLPDDRLCPPVPVRYEYIRWIRDLVNSSSEDYTEDDTNREAIGIDIGVGASCIYPLLGCASNPTWRFGGTELDSKNFEFASNNVAQNALQNRIRIRKVSPGGPLINLSALGIQYATFVMCNPPFFGSTREMEATFSNKQKPPSAVCTGVQVEMVTEGGEVGFVTRMIEESIKLRDKIQWFSSMLGKLESVGEIVTKLRQLKIENYALNILQAGNVTKRWVVAWSFGDLRPRNDVARGKLIANNLPFPTSLNISLPDISMRINATRMNAILSQLDLKWSWNKDKLTGDCFARENVWSRAARRKRRNEGGQGRQKSEASDDDEFALGVRIKVNLEDSEVEVRWLRGTDQVLFESFRGMLHREITGNKKKGAEAPTSGQVALS